MPQLEADDNNYSSSPPHRLPTLSASQALQSLSSSLRAPLGTGLRALDAALQDNDTSGSQHGTTGGITRGAITEIYGPPGAGKTMFALQVASTAVRVGGSAIWVDTSSQVAQPRLRDIAQNAGERDCEAGQESNVALSPLYEELSKLHHFQIPTLAHLFALLASSTDTFPPHNTSLIVIDTISALFALAYPKPTDGDTRQQTPQKKSEGAQWASNRRWAVLGDLISKLNRIAISRNIAIVLISQTVTRVRSDTGALLYPAISGSAWEGGINNRIVLYRDWPAEATVSSQAQDNKPCMRFAGVTKAKGVVYEGVGKLVAFVIEKHGLVEIPLDESKVPSRLPPTLAPTTLLKRKRNEIADSDSEPEEVASDQEFGWGQEDEMLRPEVLLG